MNWIFKAHSRSLSTIRLSNCRFFYQKTVNKFKDVRREDVINFTTDRRKWIQDMFNSKQISRPFYQLGLFQCDVLENNTFTNPTSEETLDLIHLRKIILIQSRRGYRTNTDSVLLSYFVQLFESKPQKILDLGCGGGIISILLGLTYNVPLYLIEKQEKLVQFSMKNLLINGMAHRSHLYHYDILNHKSNYDQFVANNHQCDPKSLQTLYQQSFDCIVCNPPYYDPHDKTRILPSNQERLTCYYETSAKLSHFIEFCRDMFTLSSTAKKTLYMIYPNENVNVLYQLLYQNGFHTIYTSKVYHQISQDLLSKDDNEPALPSTNTKNSSPNTNIIKGINIDNNTFYDDYYIYNKATILNKQPIRLLIRAEYTPQLPISHHYLPSISIYPNNKNGQHPKYYSSYIQQYLETLPLGFNNIKVDHFDHLYKG